MKLSGKKYHSSKETKKPLAKQVKSAEGKNTSGKDHAAQKSHRAASTILKVKENVEVYGSISRFRAIGNSKGIILPNRLIEEAGIPLDADILIQASNGVITIVRTTSASFINTNIATWDAQFKAALKAGAGPEKDLFENLKNKFDEEEWT